MPTPGSCQFALVVFAEHEFRYTRPLEEVVSKVAQAWKRNGHFKRFLAVASQYAEMFGGSPKCFCNFGTWRVCALQGQGPNTHLIGG